MPPRKKPLKPSGSHKNPRILVTGSPDEIDAWARVAAAEGKDRSTWLRDLANERVAAAPAGVEIARKRAWDAARSADVLAAAEQIKGRPISAGPSVNPRAITPARLETLLAQLSGFAGWSVKFDGPEFEAKPPPMPKDWKP